MRLFLLLCLSLPVACSAPGSKSSDEEANSAKVATVLEVMSFNIRYGTARDGDHVWPNRRALVADRIDQVQPDVLALQEALDFQLEELKPSLDQYVKLGQHRDGGTQGEFSGLYVDQSRWSVVDWGEFWLSPTPDEVGSSGWDAALPRMAVWADLQSREGGQRVRVYGTHYDHRGQRARAESSDLIVEHAAAFDGPVVVTGDFNALESSAALKPYFREGFRSAMSELHPADSRGTFNGWKDESGGRRIDHLLYRGLVPHTAEIFSGRVGELFPSDHDAIVATFTAI